MLHTPPHSGTTSAADRDTIMRTASTMRLALQTTRTARRTHLRRTAVALAPDAAARRPASESSRRRDAPAAAAPAAAIPSAARCVVAATEGAVVAAGFDDEDDGT